MKKIRTAALAATALGAIAVTAGCGSSSSSTTASSTGAAQSAVNAVKAKVGSPVAVSLNEMKIVAVPATAAAGDVTFVVKNSGKLTHEMVVIKTDKSASSLGPADSAGKVPETGSQGETGDVAAGAAKTVKLKLAAGHYALICNIPGHYAAGMHQDFTVS